MKEKKKCLADVKFSQYCSWGGSWIIIITDFFFDFFLLTYSSGSPNIIARVPL